MATQNQQTVQCEVLTDSGQTVYRAVGIVKQNQQMVHCEVVTGSRQTVEDSSGHSDTDPTDGTL